jgi:homoserine/homoserine lactone efflux protein
MSLELWLVYFAASVGLSLTPGPNGLLSLTHGASYGFLRTIPTVLGGALGFFILIAASLAGVGALLATSEVAFTIVKWAGAAYLIYLGVRVWNSPVPDVALDSRRPRQVRVRRSKLFAQGFLVAVSNPKGLIFFAAFLPQFITPDTPYWLQLLVFGGTFVTIEIAYELLLARFAQGIAPWLARYGKWFNRATGGTFVGLGAALTAANR